MWLDHLKIAIVEKDIDKINTLLEDLPDLENPQELDSAICLLKEAEKLMYSLQNETEKSMQQMKKNMNYLKSTQDKRTSGLDIKS